MRFGIELLTRMYAYSTPPAGAAISEPPDFPIMMFPKLNVQFRYILDDILLRPFRLSTPVIDVSHHAVEEIAA